MKSLVSIIIPSFNSAQWVTDAIDCALAQTYSPCEVIVVDDGSTDDTPSLLIQKYGDSIKYIYQENKGLAGARNTGLRHAKGDYIQFLDADDLIANTKIQKQIEVLSDISNPLLSYCDYIYCDMESIENGLRDLYVSPRLNDRIPFLYDLASRWEAGLCMPVHCFLFSSSLFKKYGIAFDENLPNHEDWDCWMRIFYLRPVVKFVDEVLAYYRIHDKSMCVNRKRMRYGFLKAIAKQKGLFKDDTEMLQILKRKERAIRYQYRDAGPVGGILSHVPVQVRKLAKKVIPWRIQRFFD